MVETEMLIYQSKANLDAKILFGKITHHLDPEIIKMPVRGFCTDENAMFNFGQRFSFHLNLNSIQLSISIASKKWTIMKLFF